LAEQPNDETIGRHSEWSERGVESDETLDTVAERLSITGSSWLPVVRRGTVVGILGMTELIGGYRRALGTSLRRLTAAGRTVLVEERIAEESAVCNKSVSEVAWSPGTVVISIERGGQLMLANGRTCLEAGDLVSALSHPQAAAVLRALLSGRAEIDGHEGAPGLLDSKEVRVG
jgi:hypothetical protein